MAKLHFAQRFGTNFSSPKQGANARTSEGTNRVSEEVCYPAFRQFTAVFGIFPSSTSRAFMAVHIFNADTASWL